MMILSEMGILNTLCAGLVLVAVLNQDKPRRKKWMQKIHSILQQTGKRNIPWLEDDQYRHLVDNQADGFIAVDADEIILYANQSAEKIFGQACKQLIGSRLDTLMDEANFLKILAETDKRKNGEKNAYELEIIRPDGDRRTVLINATPRFNDQGEYEGAYGAFVDLTERKNIEAALRENQERYQALYISEKRHVQELALLDRVRTALANEIELGNIYRLIVEAIAETFGYTQVSLFLVRNGQLEVEHQVGYTNIVSTIPLDRGVTGRVVRTGEPILLENVLDDPEYISGADGISSEVTVPILDRGQIIGVLNVESSQGVKLTEEDLQLMLILSEHISIAIGRTRLFSQARESEASYRTLANNLPGIVFRLLLKENRSVEFFNPMLEEITGYLPNEIRPGKYSPIESLVLIDDRRKVNLTIQQAIQKKKPFEVEYRIRNKDGRTRYCVERGRPIAGSDGTPIHIDGVILDITDRRQAEERTAKYARQLEALYAISLAINSQTDSNALLRKIVENATQMVGARMGGLFLSTPEGTKIELAVTYNFPEKYIGTTLQAGEGLSGKAVQSGKPIFVTDYSAWENRSPLYNELNFKRVLVVPLIVKGKVIGVIDILDSDNSQPFSEDDVRLITLFADQAAIAVENTRLYARMERQAILDELTNLYNRRGLMDLGRREVDRAMRFFRPLSAIFIDIDHFKDFNDRYSHATGDIVLSTVGETLKHGVRDVDLVGRYGGEEFVILLVETHLHTAQEIANRLRWQVEMTKISTSQGSLGVTVSMGVAQLHNGKATLDDLIHRADQAMYRAKLAGRNCVMVEPE